MEIAPKRKQKYLLMTIICTNVFRKNELDLEEYMRSSVKQEKLAGY